MKRRRAPAWNGCGRRAPVPHICYICVKNIDARAVLCYFISLCDIARYQSDVFYELPKMLFVEIDYYM
jgi:hypothetical protein